MSKKHIMSIIEHIFSTLADYTYPLKQRNEEYRKAANDFAAALDEYLLTVSAEQRAAIMDLEARRNQLASMDEEFAFTLGFRTAAHLMQELR